MEDIKYEDIVRSKRGSAVYQNRRFGDVAWFSAEGAGGKGTRGCRDLPLYCQIKPEWRDKMYYLRNLYVQVAGAASTAASLCMKRTA